MNIEELIQEIKLKIQQNKNQDLTTPEIELLANRMRKQIVTMVHRAKSGHPGGPLGLADILAVLYTKHLGITPENSKSPNRNRFLLSNGHTCAGLYAAMALANLIPEEELNEFRKLGSRLQGHPSTRYLPVLENSSGSLGQGLSQACGVALGLRQQKIGAKVYIGISDGECQEGMTWEAAMSAAHYGLDNLIAYIDYNHIQIDGRTEDVMNLGDLEAKFHAFGWLTRTVPGHDIEKIDEAFHWGAQPEKKPKIILFSTTLGKGVSFMENNPAWHGSPPDDENYNLAIAELEAIDTSLTAKLS